MGLITISNKRRLFVILRDITAVSWIDGNSYFKRMLNNDWYNQNIFVKKSYLNYFVHHFRHFKERAGRTKSNMIKKTFLHQ